MGPLPGEARPAAQKMSFAALVRIEGFPETPQSSMVLRKNDTHA